MNTFNRLSQRFQSRKKSQPASGEKKDPSEASGPRPDSPRILVIGVGNEFRGDDAVGICVARRLAVLKLPGVSVIEQSGEGADLIEAWQDCECVYLIDAVSAQGMTGSVYRFEAHGQPLPAQHFGVSSHAFGVAEAIEISRNLGQLPPKVVVYGIESHNFETGKDLSPAVQQAAENVIRQLLQEIEGL